MELAFEDVLDDALDEALELTFEDVLDEALELTLDDVLEEVLEPALDDFLEEALEDVLEEVSEDSSAALSDSSSFSAKREMTCRARLSMDETSLTLTLTLQPLNRAQSASHRLSSTAVALRFIRVPLTF